MIRAWTRRRRGAVLLDGVGAARRRLRGAAAAGGPRLPDARAAAVRRDGAGGRGLRPAPAGVGRGARWRPPSTRRSSWSGCRRSGSASGIPTRSPAASSGAWRSPACSPCGRGCCCWTSRSSASTRRRGASSSAILERLQGGRRHAGAGDARRRPRVGAVRRAAGARRRAGWSPPAPGTSAPAAPRLLAANRLREPFLVELWRRLGRDPRRGAAHRGRGGGGAGVRAGDRPVLPRRLAVSTGSTRAPSSSP